MGGFIRNIAPYTAVLQGQQQGQNASEYARRQMEQQQIQDQLNRALLMGKLQDMQAQQKAMSGLPADEQQFLNLGGSITDWRKRQDMTTQANALSDQMYQGAMDTSKSPEERMSLFQKAAQLRTNPELVSLPEFQKYGSGTEKASRQWEFVDKDTGAPIIYSGGPIPPNAVPASVYSTMHKTPPQTPKEKWLDMPIGEMKGTNWVTPSGEAFTNPAMTAREAIAAGGAALTDKNRDLLGQAQEASSNLQGLLDAGAKVLPKSTEPGVTNLLLDPIKRSIRMRTDPVYAAYAHSLAGIIPYMRNLAGVGRVNQTEMNLIVDRLQSANTYPALQSAVQEANRIINNARANITKAGRLSTGSANMTPSSTDKSIGWSPDGREVMQRSDGSKYLR